MSYICVDNTGTVYINAAMITQVRPFPPGEHTCEVTLACGTKHLLSMNCHEFLKGLRCGFSHEHNE
jgi:hypothetical protein